MNEQTKKYWDEFWQGKVAPANVFAEQFGWEYTPLADELARLIIDGRKTATCSAYVLYELDNTPLPKEEVYTIILSSKDEPLAIIKTVDVQLVPMNEITEEFAKVEGEGDLSYQHWYDGHKKFFTEELAGYGKEFSEDMLLVCEWFELVDVKEIL